MAWHRHPPNGWLVLITRGASNGRFAALAKGTIYAWPQNDPENAGRSPAKEWLCDVVKHARGDVFCVATPARHKDANDWTRAECVDVMAVVNAASPIPKPGHCTPNGRAPDSSTPFDPTAVLDEFASYDCGASFRRALGHHCLSLPSVWCA
jgi:hypothetical protein